MRPSPGGIRCCAGCWRPGSSSSDALGLGLATDAGGALLDAEGRASEGLFTLGPPRRGDLWESTAIPEIRVQAQSLSRRLLERLAPRADAPHGTTFPSPTFS